MEDEGCGAAPHSSAGTDSIPGRTRSLGANNEGQSGDGGRIGMGRDDRTMKNWDISARRCNSAPPPTRVAWAPGEPTALRSSSCSRWREATHHGNDMGGLFIDLSSYEARESIISDSSSSSSVSPLRPLSGTSNPALSRSTSTLSMSHEKGEIIKGNSPHSTAAAAAAVHGDNETGEMTTPAELGTGPYLVTVGPQLWSNGSSHDLQHGTFDHFPAVEPEEKSEEGGDYGKVDREGSINDGSGEEAGEEGSVELAVATEARAPTMVPTRVLVESGEAREGVVIEGRRSIRMVSVRRYLGSRKR